MGLPRRRPLLIGVVHLAPLPGSPRHRDPIDRILERALADARSLVRGGMDALIVENYGDLPFHPGAVPPETVASLAILAREIRRAVSVPVGVNCLRNDARAAIGIAAAADAAFVRVNCHLGAAAAEAILEGRAHETLRARRLLCPRTAILADVHVKHAVPLGGGDIAAAARDLAYRGLADALVVTGKETGRPVEIEDLRAVRRAVPDRPLLAGSGVSPENAAEILAVADGAIVGTSLERGGRSGAPVDLDRVRALVRAAR
ncbi:MAG TPA: BtpA/SgcQ family protein [Planctomycetota bacterium]|jgi:hypothetical protein|nr:BtpA/SgcQ family protein [Planctomycetota bacterium]